MKNSFQISPTFTLTALILLSFSVFYFLGSVISPFIIGFTFAYLLNPLKEKAIKYGLRPSVAAFLLTCLLFIAILMFSLTILPVLVKQFLILSNIISSNSNDIRAYFVEHFNSIKGVYPQIAVRVEELVSNFSGSILKFASHVIFSAFNSSIAAINLLAIALISPIALYYSLKDWETIKNSVTQLVPKKYQHDSHMLLKKIDQGLSSYIRGQLLVCSILALFYATSLALAGLDSGFTLGILSGFLIFIPYLGAIFSSLLCLLIAILQTSSIQFAALIAIIFATGQVLESNLLTPYFIGRSIGISPLWIIFAVLAGGVLFGFIGVLLALPLTAVIGVIIRFSLDKYLQSKFYNN